MTRFNGRHHLNADKEFKIVIFRVIRYEKAGTERNFKQTFNVQLALIMGAEVIIILEWFVKGVI